MFMRPSFNPVVGVSNPDIDPSSCFQILCLQPLLEPHELEDVNLDDESSVKLGIAWLKLVTFVIQPLYSLRELLESCPGLLFLCLSFDARSADNIPTILATPPLRHRLQEWDTIKSYPVHAETGDFVFGIMKWIFLDVEDIVFWRGKYEPRTRLSLA